MHYSKAKKEAGTGVPCIRRETRAKCLEQNQQWIGLTLKRTSFKSKKRCLLILKKSDININNYII